MPSASDVTDFFGDIYVFIGLESAAWSAADFGACFAKLAALGIHTALVKVADGAIEWHGGVTTFYQKLAPFAQVHSMRVIPYVYSYGNTYNAILQEIDVYNAVLETYGGIVLDMEGEYDGKPEWVQQLVNGLTPHGVVCVSTWANINAHNWAENVKILNARTLAFMPQVYDDYLAQFESDYVNAGAAFLAPTADFSQDTGPNDITAKVQLWIDHKHASIGFWYDAYVFNDVSYFEYLVSLWRNRTMIPNGWHDDGRTLTAPNGKQVTLGFRLYILTHNWDASNQPLEDASGADPVNDSDPSSGAGTQQTFVYSRLVWQKSNNQVSVSPIGAEYLLLRETVAKQKLPPDVVTALTMLDAAAKKYE